MRRGQGAPAANATQAAARAAPAAAAGVPDFTVTTLEGKTLRLSELRGQVVVVDYWATWCGPCRIAMPHLQKLHEEYQSQGVTVLALSVDQKGPSVVVPFIRQNGFTFAVAMADERSRVGLRQLLEHPDHGDRAAGRPGPPRSRACTYEGVRRRGEGRARRLPGRGAEPCRR
ncbi:MAG: TlpA family protein disulfide reductase [bacterium]|nr:TlpA family protein disulfide reductase [bacterium]